jgi:hypothetical protein
MNMRSSLKTARSWVPAMSWWNYELRRIRQASGQLLPDKPETPAQVWLRFTTHSHKQPDLGCKLRRVMCGRNRTKHTQTSLYGKPTQSNRITSSNRQTARERHCQRQFHLQEQMIDFQEKSYGRHPSQAALLNFIQAILATERTGEPVRRKHQQLHRATDLREWGDFRHSRLTFWQNVHCHRRRVDKFL